MKTKIRAILAAAVQAGCKRIVLSAFGCGAYANPPARVASLFREELGLWPIDATFCILEDHNPHIGHRREGNLMPFLREFGYESPLE